MFAMFTSCSTTSQTKQSGEIQMQLSEKEYQIAENTNKFSLNLFHEAYKNTENENFCISPMSVSWALSMAANGAESNTVKQLYNILGFEGIDVDSINMFQQKTILRMSALDPEKVKTGIANSAWINKNFKIKKEFIKRNTEYYDAVIKNTTFDITSEKEINDWCSEKTAGKISEIVKNIDPMTQMLLINALYFNGRWGTIFSKKRTKEETFTKENGEKINVQMMHQKFDTRYYEDSNVQMAEKKFGRGVFSMYFILPKEGVSMDKTAEEIAIKFTEWCNKAEKYEVNFALPRFKTEYGTSLKQTLQRLGITDAFAPDKANFKTLSNENICIGDVIQKTFIKVDEEGAEAAAVTSVSLMSTALGPPIPKEMIINRPFFYIIRENGTGNILFIGKNGHPKEL